MNRSQPLISVIIPVYKVEAYLENCIESIRHQSYLNLEIILVDDGSPDGCPEICDRYAKEDSRIKVIHKANGGLSDARNAGIDVARGAYITFVDSDDYIRSDMLEKLLAPFYKDSNIDITIGNFLRVYDQYSYTDDACPEHVCYDRDAMLDIYLSDSSGIWQVAWGKLYKRELFATIRYPFGKKREDEYTTYQLICEANRIAYIDSKFYFYLQRPDSIMGQRNLNLEMDLITALLQRDLFFKKKKKYHLQKKSSISSLYWIKQYEKMCSNMGKDFETICVENFRKWFSINWKLLTVKERIYLASLVIRRKTLK